MDETEPTKPTVRRSTEVALIISVIWFGLMIVALAWNSHQYTACVRGDDWMCFDLTVPIVAFWGLMLAVGWAIFGVVRALRRYLRNRV